MTFKYAVTKSQRAATPRCFVCGGQVLYDTDLAGGFDFRGRRHRVCPRCRGEFHEPMTQAAAFGLRFRFIEKGEIPRRDDCGLDLASRNRLLRHRVFAQIFAILLLAKERQEIREKEVNWMVDEMTRKILRLPEQVARILRQTYTACGDDFKLTDDLALQQIMDLLEDIDPEIMKRKRSRKKLS